MSSTSPAPTSPTSSSTSPNQNNNATTTTATATTATATAKTFPSDSLRPTIRKQLLSKFSGATWDRDKAAVRNITKEVADSVKKSMVEIDPKGFKYIVQVQLVENLGQGGRADLSCYWEEGDTVVQDVFSNDSLVCTVSAYAIKC